MTTKIFLVSDIMSWFPFHYRDVKALAKDGLYLSTTSNEAAKLFDSAVTQVALHDQDPQDGNLMETLTKMNTADPDFVMGKTMSFAFQLMECSPRQNTKLLYDVNNFVDESKKKNITDW